MHAAQNQTGLTLKPTGPQSGWVKEEALGQLGEFQVFQAGLLWAGPSPRLQITFCPLKRAFPYPSKNAGLRAGQPALTAQSYQPELGAPSAGEREVGHGEGPKAWEGAPPA